MRAIPVNPEDRVVDTDEEFRGGVRIYRGRPVESPSRRVVRIVPVEE
jgi:hypothetical protein